MKPFKGEFKKDLLAKKKPLSVIAAQISKTTNTVQPSIMVPIHFIP